MSFLKSIFKTDIKIKAPVDGEIISLEKVNDYVFQNKLMGDGLAIIPSSGDIFSPISGNVAFVFPTKHVIGIQSKEGVNIIIHIGIETVSLNGEGFDVYVKEGDEVIAGDLLVKFDNNCMSQQYDMTTMVIVENGKEQDIKDRSCNEIKHGELLFVVNR